MIAEIILHSLNKLTKTFVENEVTCCNQLYDHINHKSGQETLKKVAEKKEEEEGYAGAMYAIKQMQSRRRLQANHTRPATMTHHEFMPIQSQHLHGSLISSNLNLIHKSFEFHSNKKITEKKRSSAKVNLFQESLVLSSLGAPMAEETGTLLKRYYKRGHMPPILRRASYYEQMKDMLVEMDSFVEDDSRSGDSS